MSVMNLLGRQQMICNTNHDQFLETTVGCLQIVSHGDGYWGKARE